MGVQDFLSLLKRALRSFLKDYTSLILLTLGGATIALGYVGFDHLSAARGIQRSPLDLFYHSISLFPLQTGQDIPLAFWELQIARFLAPALTLFALYKFITVFFADRVQSLMLQFVRDHVIVCGMGYLGPEIVAKFHEKRRPIVVIEADKEDKRLDACREMGAFVVIGDAADGAVLKKARLGRARHLFAVTEDDGLNAEIAAKCHQMIGDEGSAGCLTCFVHSVDAGLCSLLKEHQMRVDSDRFTLELFNIYQTAGQYIMKEHPPFSETEKAPPEAHVLIVGAGRMGESLVFHAVKRWRAVYGSVKKIRVTVVDRDAMLKAEKLRLRYPSLSRFCDLVPLSIGLESADFVQSAFLFKDGRVSVTAIYICLSDQSAGLAAALHLNQRLNDYAVRQQVPKPAVPIVVRTGKDGMVTLFDEINRAAGSFGNLHAFPLIDRACNVDAITGGLNETIARAVHEDYLLKQMQKGATPGASPSLLEWDLLPETLRASNRSQAANILQKLRTTGCDIAPLIDWDEEPFQFTPGELETMAEFEHARFVAERVRQGWKYGPVKDVEKKITPFLVPYDQLSEEIKDLDRDTIRALPAVLERVDLRIVRTPGQERPGEWKQETKVVSACK